MTLPNPRERPLLQPGDLVGLIPGMGRSAIYEAVRRGDLPSVRCGRRVFIPTAALLAQWGLSPDMQAAGPASPATATSPARRLEGEVVGLHDRTPPAA